MLFVDHWRMVCQFLSEGVYRPGMNVYRFLLPLLLFLSASVSESEARWRFWARSDARKRPAVHESVVRAPYLQNATTGGVTVVWRTDREIAPVVRYGLIATDLSHRTQGDAVRWLPDPGGEADTAREPALPSETSEYQWEALLEVVEPGALHWYAVYDGEQRLAGDESYFFRAYPSGELEPNVRIWAFGCGGTGGEEARAAYRAASEFAAADGRPIDLWLYAGDLAYYDGTDAEFQAHLFEIYRPALQQVVCWPAFGNHDGHSADGVAGRGPYFDAFVLPTQGEGGGVPSETESFYSFRHGRVHFISLNSYDEERGPEGRMAQWLRRDLAAAREAVDWIVAFWHHPPYSKGSHDSDTELPMVEMREWIMPILEEGGVDLVVHAHSHTYERSMLIDGAYATPTVARGHILDDGDGHPRGSGEYIKPENIVPRAGLVSVVVGTGGGVLNRMGTHPLMRRTELEYGSLLIDIQGTRLLARMITNEGEVLDEFGMIKRGTEVTAPLEAPWLPLGPVIEPGVEFFLDEMQIRIGSPTEWPAEQIHYTLDGQEPSLMTAYYGGPLAITNEVTVRARAWAPRLGHVSPVSEARFVPYTETVHVGVDAVEDHLAPGLRFRRYEGDWTRLPDFNELEPVEEGVATTVRADVAGDGDHFGLTFEGFFRAPVRDVYTFSLTSDDGSRLILHNKVVVDNDGLHPAREVRGAIGLEAGLHPVRIEFFEGREDHFLRLGFETPNLKRQEAGPDRWMHERALPFEADVTFEWPESKDETEPLTSGIDSLP